MRPRRRDRQSPPSPLRAGLRRFPALALLVAFLGTLLTAAVLERVRGDGGFRGRGNYVVTSLTPEQAALLPITVGIDTNTDRAARTYALVLRRDANVLAAMAARLGVGVAEIRDRIDGFYVRGSSTVVVLYTAPREQEVLDFFAAFDAVVTSPERVSPNLAPGTVRPLSLGVFGVATRDIPAPDVLSVLGGLGLAGLLVALLDRGLPRVTHVGLLTGMGRSVGPGGQRREPDVALAHAVLTEPGPRLLVVHVWGLGSGSGGAAALVAARLEAACPAASLRATDPVRLPEDVTWAAGVIDESDGSPRASWASLDLHVLVVPYGASLRQVRRVVDALSSGRVFVVFVPRDAAVAPAPAALVAS